MASACFMIDIMESLKYTNATQLEYILQTLYSTVELMFSISLYHIKLQFDWLMMGQVSC